LEALSAVEIAELILSKSDNPLSHRKLQKLLYYCQALSLHEHNEPIFSDAIEAWEFGPVCSKVFHTWKGYGYKTLPKVTIDISKYPIKTINIVLVVLATFGSLSQEELIEMSHIDAPWANNYIDSRNNILNIEAIAEYFAGFSDMEEYLDYVHNRQKYISLISSRKSYLQGLVELGDDWITGDCIAPNKESITLASKILTISKDILNKNQKLSIPKLILGPIPSGGVGIEFVQNNENKMFVTIHHNNFVEIDVEIDGSFEEHEEDYQSAIGKYEQLFGSFA